MIVPDVTNFDRMMSDYFDRTVIYVSGEVLRMPERIIRAPRHQTLKSNLMPKFGIKKRRSAKSLKRWKKQKAQRRARKITARCRKCS